jgi:hypothetical protein
LKSKLITSHQHLYFEERLRNVLALTQNIDFRWARWAIGGIKLGPRDKKKKLIQDHTARNVGFRSNPVFAETETERRQGR